MTQNKSELFAPCGRSFKTSWSLLDMDRLYKSVFGSYYRSVPIYKTAIDLFLYMQLLERLKPNTIIEIGSKSGGSALWFADMISAAGRNPQIISIDIEPVTTLRDDRIRFVRGDACDLGAVLTSDVLEALPRPWMVTEDSAHFYETSRGVLDFFDSKLKPGEYVVIEDGLVDEFEDQSFRALKNGPNRAVAAFLRDASERYAIDPGICDFFGYNATFNPNGWLKRI